MQWSDMLYALWSILWRGCLGMMVFILGILLCGLLDHWFLNSRYGVVDIIVNNIGLFVVVVFTSGSMAAFMLPVLQLCTGSIDSVLAVASQNEEVIKGLTRSISQLESKTSDLAVFGSKYAKLARQVDDCAAVIQQTLDPQKVVDSAARAVADAVQQCTPELTKQLDAAVMKCEASITEQGLSIVMNSLPFHEQFAEFDDALKVAYFNAMTTGNWNQVNKKVRSLKRQEKRI